MAGRSAKRINQFVHIRAAAIYRDIFYISRHAIYRDIFFWRFAIFLGGFHDKNLRGNRRKSTVIGRN